MASLTNETSYELFKLIGEYPTKERAQFETTNEAGEKITVDCPSPNYEELMGIYKEKLVHAFHIPMWGEGIVYMELMSADLKDMNLRYQGEDTMRNVEGIIRDRIAKKDDLYHY